MIRNVRVVGEVFYLDLCELFLVALIPKSMPHPNDCRNVTAQVKFTTGGV